MWSCLAVDVLLCQVSDFVFFPVHDFPYKRRKLCWSTPTARPRLVSAAFFSPNHKRNWLWLDDIDLWCAVRPKLGRCHGAELPADMFGATLQLMFSPCPVSDVVFFLSTIFRTSAGNCVGRRPLHALGLFPPHSCVYSCSPRSGLGFCFLSFPRFSVQAPETMLVNTHRTP